MSTGHCGRSPSQTSATSQSPAAARQVSLPPKSASGGHAPLEPVHVSATSHGPTDARHVVAPPSTTSAGHIIDPSVQASSKSQAPALGRHVTVGAIVTERAPHVPSAAAPAASLHAMQSTALPPPHGSSQHTPSTQFVLVQSEPIVHSQPLVTHAHSAAMQAGIHTRMVGSVVAEQAAMSTSKLS